MSAHACRVCGALTDECSMQGMACRACADAAVRAWKPAWMKEAAVSARGPAEAMAGHIPMGERDGDRDALQPPARPARAPKSVPEAQQQGLIP